MLALSRRIDIGDRLSEVPANVAWGGHDNRTMLFAARTSIYTMRMITKGTRIPIL